MSGGNKEHHGENKGHYSWRQGTSIGEARNITGGNKEHHWRKQGTPLGGQESSLGETRNKTWGNEEQNLRKQVTSLGENKETLVRKDKKHHWWKERKLFCRKQPLRKHIILY